MAETGREKLVRETSLESWIWVMHVWPSREEVPRWRGVEKFVTVDGSAWACEEGGGM